MISGLMVLKNGLDLGYPFVEAITQVIDSVDEFVIIECGSTDKTMDILDRLVMKYIGKLKVYVHPWDFTGNDGERIGEIQTIGMRLCKGDYILLVQADEIWSKKSLEIVVELPKKYPLVGIFEFNFIHILGNMQLRGHSYDYAVRLCQNDPRIVSEADGWTIRGFVPNLTIDLPEPIFHCGSMGWKNNYRKIAHHGDLYKKNKVYQTRAKYYAKKLMEENPEEFLLKKETSFSVPEIIKPFLGVENYFVREELLCK